MKFVIKLLMCFLMVFALTADVSAVTGMGIFGAGSYLTDGETSYRKVFVGMEMRIIEDLDKGFKLNVRTLYTQVSVPTDVEEIQRIEVWEINQMTIKKDWWNWYLAAGVGGLNEFEDGDDLISFGVKFETGFKLFNKLNLSLGIDLLPNDPEKGGDNQFVYGLMNFGI